MAAKWFVIKTFYRSTAEGRPEKPDRFYDPDATLVEERSLLIKAMNKTEAVKKAEKEAENYARSVRYQNPYGQTVSTRYLGCYDVYPVEDSLTDKKEIFSTSRIMSKRINDRKIAYVYIGKRDNLFQSKRKKFLNNLYETN